MAGALMDFATVSGGTQPMPNLREGSAHHNDREQDQLSSPGSIGDGRPDE